MKPPYCKDCSESDPAKFYHHPDGKIHLRHKCHQCLKSYDKIRKGLEKPVETNPGFALAHAPWMLS